MIAITVVTRRKGSARERGFTLVELMVGIALGLIVLATLTVVFVSASTGRRDMERTGRQIENGRYAMQLIDDDLVNAGYFGEFDPNTVGAPGVKPDPCATDVAREGRGAVAYPGLRGSLGQTGVPRRRAGQHRCRRDPPHQHLHRGSPELRSAGGR